MQVDIENYNIKEITTEVSNTFLKGERGDTGSQGPQGIQGIQGEKGIQGEQGPVGPIGNGIEDISIELSAGINSVYIIRLTDGRTKEFVVRNGRGIEKIEKVDTTGLVDTYQITFNDMTTTTFQIKNGEKGDTGSQGPQGIQGMQGEKGEKGDTGPANTISIGTVSSGTEASATIIGNAPNQILNLVLPKGDKGDTGAIGPQGPKGDTGSTPDMTGYATETYVNAYVSNMLTDFGNQFSTALLDFYDKAEIDAKLGNIESLLASI